jgi:hypothetical protein
VGFLAHSGPCTRADSFTTIGIGTIVGLLLFRPWRKSVTSSAAKLSRWALPLVLAGAVTVGACSPKSGTSAVRPNTDARLEIVAPTPSATMPPSFMLQLNLIGAKVVPAEVTGGPLRGDEGHIHVSLDGKLVSMTYGLSQDLNNLAAGPHNVQAEFVATDHAPFANRVIVAVAFSVAP